MKVNILGEICPNKPKYTRKRNKYQIVTEETVLCRTGGGIPGTQQEKDLAPRAQINELWNTTTAV